MDIRWCWPSFQSAPIRSDLASRRVDGAVRLTPAGTAQEVARMIFTTEAGCKTAHATRMTARTAVWSEEK